jgi:hypothetical protein
MNIQPIETTYKGYKFRSRVEARWAVVFDTLDIPWEYEKEGYSLPSGAYLPDFWLPTVTIDGQEGVWFEVKGKYPTHHEYQLASELRMATNKPVVFAYASIPPAEEIDFVSSDHMIVLHTVPEEDKDYAIQWATENPSGKIWIDEPIALAYCDDCGSCAFVYLGYWNRMCRHFTDDNGRYALPSKKLRNAYRAGRAARFEHKKRLFG